MPFPPSLVGTTVTRKRNQNVSVEELQVALGRRHSSQKQTVEIEVASLLCHVYRLALLSRNGADVNSQKSKLIQVNDRLKDLEILFRISSIKLELSDSSVFTYRVPMKSRSVLSIAGALITSLSVPIAVSAVQLSNGTVYFNSPPRLAGAATTQNGVYAWSATYYFDLEVPENAGEPLQKVTIAQEPSGDTVRFSEKETAAFENGRRGNRLTLGEVTSDRKTRTVTVNFNPPIQPGRKVTIALSPDRNPAYAGVYLFGVTAFPAGEKSYGQFLGFGRLHFYDSGPDGFFFRRGRIFR